MFDFSHCDTTEDLQRELDLIAAAYTRKFVDEAINGRNGTKDHTGWARNNGVAFAIRADATAPDGVDTEILIPGHPIDDTLHDSGVQALVLGTIYGDEVIRPAVVPAVAAWRTAHTS